MILEWFEGGRTFGVGTCSFLGRLHARPGRGGDVSDALKCRRIADTSPFRHRGNLTSAINIRFPLLSSSPHGSDRPPVFPRLASTSLPPIIYHHPHALVYSPILTRTLLTHEPFLKTKKKKKDFFLDVFVSTPVAKACGFNAGF